ncbi:MAG TPA: rhodanese-like domain-containing protein [Candidatus Saccharibacteria bacterium]|nr:rhodanese-like domain-containing protein [Candidatus Saccharibacteria bacterium]
MLIDVRNPEEFNQGHYKGAINFDLNLMMQGELPNLPKDAKIEVYCRSGGRAEAAKQILNSAGFNDAENIGGYQA